MRIIIINLRILSCLPCCRGIRFYYPMRTSAHRGHYYYLCRNPNICIIPGSLFFYEVDMLQYIGRSWCNLSRIFRICNVSISFYFMCFYSIKTLTTIPCLTVYKFVVIPSNVSFLALLFTLCQSNIRSLHAVHCFLHTFFHLKTTVTSILYLIIIKPLAVVSLITSHLRSNGDSEFKGLPPEWWRTLIV